MKRPWQVWLVFTACVLGAAAGMAWLTQQALRADERRRAAEAEAELEQRVSLALWRMDTELAPIIAEEVIRPTSAFRPSSGSPTEAPPYVFMQFECRENGVCESPQAAPKQKKESQKQSPESSRLAELSAAVDLPRLIAELPSAPLPTAANVGKNLLAANAQPAAANAEAENPFPFFEGNTTNPPGQSLEQVQERSPQQVAVKGKNLSKEADFQQRGKRYQDATQQSLLNSEQRAGAQNIATNSPPSNANAPQVDLRVAPEQVGVSRPVWLGDRLLLARRVTSNGRTFVQGSWLDWPQLKSQLLGEASDLLPKVDLTPVNGEGANDPSRMLAGLPVRLVVGETAAAGAIGPTLRWALEIGWGAVLLAVIAAAFLLQGVITLSERRAAFVSSVTHELRTPLTTFRMYAEMLARGMVPDPERRQEYFYTLQREAERLTLLVENVLAYARLERGRRPHAQDCVTLATLLDRVGPRLKQRAAQAGMECIIELQDSNARSPCPLPKGEGLDHEFTTDQGVVEQILFNLVDNAAKYARDAEDRRIHVEAHRNGRCMRLIVRDHGPGIDQQPWSRRMQPFGKSAQESADSAPGVGLGLALCRRLARQLGGGLEIAATPGGGASVTLLLPVS